MKGVFITTSICFITTISANAQILTDSTSVPVSISRIDVVANTDNNKLNWKTACFLSFAKFDIQRSYDGVNYTTIDGFTADRQRCEEPFDYFDYTANRLAGRVYYRLSVGNTVGQVYNSRIVTAFTNGQGVQINSLTPSIASSSTALSVSSSTVDNSVITITNTQGKIVKTIPTTLSKGINTIQIGVADLMTGRYWLTLRSNKDKIQQTSFIKQ